MKRHWAPDELAEHWTLHPDELGLLANKTGATRLGFALLLKAFIYEGRFPRSPAELPEAVVGLVARQVEVPAELYPRYEWAGRTLRYHRAQIRAFLGFREATVQDGHALVAWLAEQVLPHEHRLEPLREAFFARCRALHLEPPAPGRVDRLLRSAGHAFEERWCATVWERLSLPTRTALEGLLTTGATTAEEPDAAVADAGRSALHELKADPGAIRLESVLVEIAKLERLRALGLPAALFHDVSPKVVERFRQRAAAEAPRELRAHAPALRATLVAALCHQRGREITDALVDLLLQVVHKIGVRAERRVEKELLADLKRVTGKTGLLFRIAEAAIAHPDECVRDIVFPAAGGEQTLRDLVREFKASGPAYRLQVHTHLRASYAAHYRRMTPPLLGALTFRSNNAAHQPLIRALALVTRYTSSSQRLYPVTEDVPLDGVVRGGIRPLVVRTDARGRERVDRINYEICVLQALREQLRCKELWVVGADRYRNPDDDLPQDFATQRDAYYAALHQPREAAAFVAGVQEALQTALDQLDRGLAQNPSVKSPRRALPPLHQCHRARESGSRDAPAAPPALPLWAGDQHRPQACGQQRRRGKLRGSPLRAAPLPAERHALCGDRRRRQRYLPHPATRRVGRGHHGLCFGLDEGRDLGPEPADRVAHPLPRAGGDDLLARRDARGVYLLAAQELLVVGSRGHDGGGAAPLHRHDGRQELRR